MTSWLKVALLFVVGTMALSTIVDFLGRIASATAVLVGALFFAYLVAPMIRALRSRLPLGAALVLVYLGIFAVIGFALAVVVPALLNDGQSLAASFPSIVHNAQRFVTDPSNPIVQHLPGSVRDYLAALPARVGSIAESVGAGVAQSALGVLLSVVTVLATAIVIPVVAAYMILEGEALRRTVIRVVPASDRAKTARVLGALDRVLGGFVRGQVLVGCVIGTCITVMLLLTHVRYAVLIGVAAGVLNVIPYVGSIAGFIPAVTLSLFDQGWQHALLVAGFFIAIFQLDGHFITPRIVSDSVGLSPLMVIVAILVGGELHGIPGMFVAVPVAAILRVLVLEMLPLKDAAALETPAEREVKEASA